MNTVIHKHEMIDNFRILKIQKSFCKSVRFYKAVLASWYHLSPHCGGVLFRIITIIQLP